MIKCRCWPFSAPDLLPSPPHPRHPHHGDQVQEVFRRVAAVRKKLPTLVPSLLAFIRGDVGPWLATQDTAAAKTPGGTLKDLRPKEQLDELLRRVRVAERVLAAAAAGGRADGSVAAGTSMRGEESQGSESDEESDDSDEDPEEAGMTDSD